MSNTWHRTAILMGVLLVVGCSGSSGHKGAGGSTGRGGNVESGGVDSGGAPGSGGSAPGTGGATAPSAGGGPGQGGATDRGGGGGPGQGGAIIESSGGKAGGAGGAVDAGSGGAGGAVDAGPVGNGGTNTGGTGPVGNGGTNTGGTGSGGNGGTNTGGTGSGGNGVSPGVRVALDKTHQTIQGFGISIALMPGSLGSSVVNTLYGTSAADSLGLSIMRIGMNSDGSLSGSQSDIDAAKSANASTKIIGSCWSAPSQCLSRSGATPSWHLLSSCFESWSTTIASFAKYHGLYAMSIGNKPDVAPCGSHGPPCGYDYDTTVFTAKEMVAWVKAAGPKLKTAGVKVIAPETSEWLHAWSNASAMGSIVASHPESMDSLKCGCFSNTPTTTGCAQTCLDGNGYDYGHWLWKDQDAWQAFDIFGVHEYDSQIAVAWPADVNDGKRDKEVWQTEMSGVMYWPEQGPSNDINNGVAVAGWIHSALTVGEASAWLYWWYQSYYQDDNEGLLTKGSTEKTKRYYTLGNYSRFVRPGYVMVDVTGNDNKDVLLSAFKSEDAKTIVVVAINKGKAAVTVPIGIAGGTAASCTPNVTSSSDNLKAGTAVTVTDGAFTASLAATTVTSFVCR